MSSAGSVAMTRVLTASLMASARGILVPSAVCHLRRVNWMSRARVSAAAKASSLVPSSVRAAMSSLDRRLKGSMIRVATPRGGIWTSGTRLRMA